ncbi:regulator of gene activity [Drosophila ananassae]|uniref:regulator of gene activity n=1 Tax=Drosophila ananassae TaxID=7217 RepID=UPI001CFF600C|nr:regulator of gene activity [Drosophila ananassae]
MDDVDSLEEVIVSDATPVSATTEKDFVEECKTLEVSSNAVRKEDNIVATKEQMEMLYGYLNSEARFDVSLIFSKQFLHEGVRQRALNGVVAKGVPNPFPNPLIGPPPGFECAKLYARMKTNRMGMPLGGVDFELVPPIYEKLWKSEVQPPRNAVEGSFGMLGLAKDLGSMTRNPLLIPQILEHESNLNLETHCCAGGSGSLHSSFSGPFLPGRCAPHELNFEVPMNYRMAGRLGLQQPKTEQMEVELLFFFFYTYPGDMMQLLSAAELAERGWRFHKFERFWIKRQADNPNYAYRGFQESGEYNYFNMFQWKILPRHFKLDPEQLERTITKEELFEMHGYHPQMAGY